MSPWDPAGRLARRRHPRLATIALVGAVLAIAGLAGWLTAGPLGHPYGTDGLRAAFIGLLGFFFGASGYLAFAVFERGFD